MLEERQREAGPVRENGFPTAVMMQVGRTYFQLFIYSALTPFVNHRR